MKNNMFIALICLFLFSCGAEKLKGLNTAQSSFFVPLKGEANVKYCSVEPETISDNLRVVFALDWTGSNVVPDCANQPGCPTDPDRAKRIPPLKDYITNRLGLPNYNPENEKYAFFQWSTNVDNWNAVNSSEVNDDNRFIPLEELSATIDAGLAVTETGGTPYLATLQKLRSAIRAEALAEKTRYEESEDPDKVLTCFESVSVFISDGFPTDASEDEILDEVGELLKLENDSEVGAYICGITLNTAFYNSVFNETADRILSGMAEKGNGKYFDFLDGTEIDYNKVTQVQTRQIVTQTVDFFAVNENMVWSTEDESYVSDVDGDRVADKYEIPYCVILPQNQSLSAPWDIYFDCDQNYARDGVEWWISDFPRTQCKGETCEPDEARILSCLGENGEPEDTDGDGLLDCEEGILKSRKDRFDTTLDGIPDPIAFRHFYNMVLPEDSDGSGIPASSKDSDNDGVTDYEEIKRMTPWSYPNSLRTNGFDEIKYIPTKTYIDPVTNLTCSNFKVEDITIGSENDQICIYLIDQELTGVGRKFLRKACKRLAPDSDGVSTTDFEIGDYELVTPR